ncbi:hypothetical protein Scep_018073 [Stephania cephalantha]|uniref:Uncharacterized protein n=1 Tax=Stephania cephalantha TaxID=152367 RepID=A0AAP0NW83_9MAGN
MSPLLFPIIIYYTKPETSTSTSTTTSSSTCLKRSLSKCLTKFYPLAGRIKDDVSVDCNDAGVDYLEAKVTNCTLLDVITNPNIPSLKQLLPCEPHIHDLESPLLLVQVNRFQCGGIAIGVCISHKVADASALGMFVNGWSCTARGDCETVAPHFELSTLFPWRDDTNDIEKESQATEGDYDHEKDNKFVTKRFVFNATDIARLRDKARNIESPTRIEVVSAFIWKRFVDLNRSKTRPTSKPYSVFHAMNLRKRRAPPLAEHGFGNMSVLVIESLETEDDDDEYCSLVGKIRSAIRGVDGEFVKKLESGDEWYLKHIKAGLIEQGKGEREQFSFTSWCWLFYDADFGWGKPVWVSPHLYYKNVVILMDTRDGEGIEAWVSLLNEDIVEFESDPDILSGRIKDEIYVDCNDAGVDYLEAKITKCSLSDVLTNRNIESLVQLLPCKPYSPETKKESSESPLLLVQVNYFDCGGIAILSVRLAQGRRHMFPKHIRERLECHSSRRLRSDHSTIRLGFRISS